MDRCESLKYRLFLLVYFIILAYTFQWNGVDRIEKQRKENEGESRTAKDRQMRKVALLIFHTPCRKNLLPVPQAVSDKRLFVPRLQFFL